MFRTFARREGRYSRLLAAAFSGARGTATGTGIRALGTDAVELMALSWPGKFVRQLENANSQVGCLRR